MLPPDRLPAGAAVPDGSPDDIPVALVGVRCGSRCRVVGHGLVPEGRRCYL